MLSFRQIEQYCYIAVQITNSAEDLTALKSQNPTLLNEIESFTKLSLVLAAVESLTSVEDDATFDSIVGYFNQHFSSGSLDELKEIAEEHLTEAIQLGLVSLDLCSEKYMSFTLTSTGKDFLYQKKQAIKRFANNNPLFVQ